MTSVRTINAQHPKNAGATVQTIKGRPSPPKKKEKWHNDKLGDQ